MQEKYAVVQIHGRLILSPNVTSLGAIDSRVLRQTSRIPD